MGVSFAPMSIPVILGRMLASLFSVRLILGPQVTGSIARIARRIEKVIKTPIALTTNVLFRLFPPSPSKILILSLMFFTQFALL